MKLCGYGTKAKDQKKCPDYEGATKNDITICFKFRDLGDEFYHCDLLPDPTKPKEIEK
jgi:hypothetical protein